MGAIERINIARTISDLSPARGLHRARNFQRQLVKVLFMFVEGNFAFTHEPQEISIS